MNLIEQQTLVSVQFSQSIIGSISFIDWLENIFFCSILTMKLRINNFYGNFLFCSSSFSHLKFAIKSHPKNTWKYNYTCEKSRQIFLRALLINTRGTMNHFRILSTKYPHLTIFSTVITSLFTSHSKKVHN